MTAYYNEIDPQSAQWLRNLIAAGHIAHGDVDERSIEDVKPDDLRGYAQCHFFAGIGVWSNALRAAGWPDDRPVWTGSCPCQPFSSAGKGAGFDDQRHLWPAWFHLIRECKPEFVFGEQVASAIGHGWLDLVQADMEAEGYAIGGTVLGAHSVGAPHIRQRLYWVADSAGARLEGAAGSRIQNGGTRFAGGGEVGELADAMQSGRAERRAGSGVGPAARGGESDELGNAIDTGLQGHGRPFSVNDAGGRERAERHGSASGFWSGAEWIACRDGKARPVEPKYIKMVDGIACRMVPRSSDSGAKEEVNGKEKTAGPGKALRGLRGINGTEDVPVCAGGYDGVSQAQVLRSGMHGPMDGGEDKSPERASAVSPVTEGSSGQVRDLRKNGDYATCASQGRESDEQCGIELDDFVRLLPSSRAFAKLHGDRETAEALLAVCQASGSEGLLQYAPHQAEEVWRSLGKEVQDRFWLEVRKGGFVRTCEPPLLQSGAVPARVVRLRAYGNAIVAPLAQAWVECYMMHESGGMPA